MDVIKGIFGRTGNPSVRGKGNEDSTFAVRLDAPSENSSITTPDELAKDGVVTDVAEPGIENYYKPIEEYEGRHRYDPKARWTEAEEKALIRRVGVTCRRSHAND